MFFNSYQSAMELVFWRKVSREIIYVHKFATAKSGACKSMAAQIPHEFPNFPLPLSPLVHIFQIFCSIMIIMLGIITD